MTGCERIKHEQSAKSFMVVVSHLATWEYQSRVRRALLGTGRCIHKMLVILVFEKGRNIVCKLYIIGVQTVIDDIHVYFHSNFDFT